MFSVILLLDDVSKKSVKLDRSVLNSTDILIVNNLLEITPEIAAQTNSVLILDEAFSRDEFIADLQLFKQLLNLNYIFLTNKEPDERIAQYFGAIYRCDTSVIDYALIQAAYYKDSSYNTKGSQQDSSEDYAKSVLTEDTIVSTNERNLASDYLESLRREKFLQEKLQAKEDELNDLAITMAKLSEDNQRWANGCQTLMQRIVAHNKMLEKYEVVFSQDVYTKLNLYDYANKPMILYFKVYTEFIGEAMFIETLVDSLRFQYGKSVKVLQLFDGSGDRQIRLLPPYYSHVRNYYKISQIIENNYLCKSGDYFNLLDRLLNNKYGLDVLIILDKKDHDECILSGTYPQFNLCRLPQQAETLGLSPSATIVNKGIDGWHNWTPVSVAGLSKQERFVKLSSRKVIKFLVETLEKFADSL